MSDASEWGAVDILRRAWKTGRPIVPFLAAGFSAKSGYPLTTDLTNYLLEVKFYIKNGVYRHTFGQDFFANSRVGFDEPEYRLSQYIADFGWPNPNQLRSDLDQFTAFNTFEQPGDDAKSRRRAMIDELTRLRQNLVAQRARELEMPSEIDFWNQKSVEKIMRQLPGSKTGSNSRDVALDKPPLQRTLQAWIDWTTLKTLPSVSKKEARSFLEYLVDTSAPHPDSGYWWGTGRWRLTTASAHVALEDLRLFNEQNANAVQGLVRTGKVTLRSDWSKLLMELTEGNLGLIDSLFSQLSLRYSPALSHILLAHLTRLLGIRLILTTNFDPYIERAMVQEGIQPRVLDVGRDEAPPDPSVVQQSLSIVKLHGGGHSLRVGERLDYALDDATRLLVEKYVPPDALLLVLGFSGYERRMMQLIEHITLASTASRVRDARDRTKVIWMHWESDEQLPPTVRQFESKVDALVGSPATSQNRVFHRQRLSDAGDFLLDVYQQLTTTLPKSNTPYQVLRKRLSDEPAPPATERVDGAKADRDVNQSPAEHGTGSQDAAWSNWAPIQLFARTSLKEKPGSAKLPFSFADDAAPSLSMSRFVQKQAGYHVIWIDLEDHHTVAGVVTDIVDKMRAFDPDLPPLVLPLDEGESLDGAVGVAKPSANRFGKATRFIHRALRRGRYIIALDSMEGFGREHTSHHGVTAHQGGDDTGQLSAVVRVKDLLEFIRKLIALPDAPTTSRPRITAHDWYCCIASDEPTARHLEQPSKPHKVLQSVRDKIASFVNTGPWKDSHVPLSKPPRSGPGSADAADDGAYCRRWCSAASIENALTKRPQAGASGDPQRPSAESGEVSNARTTVAEWLSLLQDPGIANSPVNESSSPAQPRKGKSFRVELDKLLDRFFRRLDRLQNPSGNLNRDMESEHNTCCGLEEFLCFLIFVVFRRPRSRTSLLTILNDYLPRGERLSFRDKRSQFDALTDRLRKWNLMFPMVGGFYWIPHHLHERSYNLLTETVRTRDLLASPAATIATNLKGTARRLVFLTMIHSRIARFYYLHVFQRTRDVNGLFEYLYHRISALRYAKLLQTALRACPESSEEIDFAVDMLWKYEAKALAGEDAVNSDAKITALRLKFVQSLLDVLQRQRETILSSASADTWLAWIKQMERDLVTIVCLRDDPKDVNEELYEKLGVDLSDDLSRVWCERIDGKNSGSPPADVKISAGKSIPTTASEGRARKAVVAELLRAGWDLHWHLGGLRGQLFREKRDWAACVRHQLWLAVEIIVAAAEASPYLAQWSGDQKGISSTLRIRVDQIAKSTSGNLKSYVEKMLKAIKETLHPSIKTFNVLLTPFQGRRSVVEPLRHLFDCFLDTAACLRHLGIQPDGKQVSDQLDEIKYLIIDPGKKWAGAQRRPRQDARTIHSAFIGMDFDYKFDKFRFKIERHRPWGHGRYNWRGKLRKSGSGPTEIPKDDDWDSWSIEIEQIRQSVRVAHVRGEDLARRLCQFDTLQAQCLLWVERFEEVHRILDRSVSLLQAETPSHRFLLAIVHWIRAHALMRSADEDVQERNDSESQATNPRASSDADDGPRPRVRSARAKLAAADATLAEAELLLSSGRRNIGQWGRLYHAKAQLQVEHLLLLLVNPGISTGRLQFVAIVQSHLVKGLEAIRGGWDCSLPTESSGNAAHNREYRRNRDVPHADTGSAPESKADRRECAVQWLQLMSCGYLALWLYSEVHRFLASDETRDTDGFLASVESHERRRTVRAAPGQTFSHLVSELPDRRDQERDLKDLADLEGYVRRWIALNESVGLGRFVVNSPNDKSKGDFPIDVWKRLLKAVAERPGPDGPDDPDDLRMRGRVGAWTRFSDSCWLRQMALKHAEDWVQRGSVSELLDSIARTPK